MKRKKELEWKNGRGKSAPRFFFFLHPQRTKGKKGLLGVALFLALSHGLLVTVNFRQSLEIN